MCKILNFPVQDSNGYKNLLTFFEMCDTVKSCNFYLESAEYLFEKGNITQRELYTLRRVGRKKRLALAAPAPQEPQEATGPGVYCYTPEMGQKRPECQMEASIGHYGRHYFIDTPLQLKGRGITFLKQYKPGDLRTSRKDGWNVYQVTSLAYEKLQKQYTISVERCLD